MNCTEPAKIANNTTPYWILDFDNVRGLGLVSGGPPTDKTLLGCEPAQDTMGLWIYTRQQV